MAIVYNQQRGATQYQVRTAGKTVRLYSNGVLHSQFNPSHMISGAIWDLLLLPAFLREESPKKILLLGLGGGTLVHLIRHFFPLAHITCVELDTNHISIAKRFFKIPKKDVVLHKDDAYDFLRNGSDRYDWIIDDVFQHVAGEPERNTRDYQSISLYRKRLSKEGLLSLNLIGKTQVENVHPLIEQFKQATQFTHPLYENRIVALGNNLLDKSAFNKALQEWKELDLRRKTCRLQYKMRRMK